MYIVGKENVKMIEEREVLRNGYCHFINKTVLFVQKYFEGVVPAGRLEEQISERTVYIYRQLEECFSEEARCRLEQGESVLTEEAYRGKEKEIYDLLLDYLREANEYFEKGNPWKQLEADRASCRKVILNTVYMAANLSVWLHCLGEACADPMVQWLELDGQWQPHRVHSGYQLPQTEELGICSEKNAFQMA